MHIVTESMVKRASVDDEHESARTLTVVTADDRRDARVDSLQPELATRVRVRLDVGCDAFLLQDAAIREELINGTKHLRVYRAATLPTTTDDDDVIIVSDEVGTVSNSYSGG